MTLLVTRDDILAARARIAPYVRRTPTLDLPAGAFDHDGPVSLKLEFLQHSGSFKARGAFNALLAGEVPPAGVAAASGGNHGAAVALAAERLGHPATVFVPAIASAAKVAAIRAAGAEIVIGGERYADAQAACDLFLRTSGAMSVHPFGRTETISGQGTLAAEWDEQRPGLDTVLVAVGGGGLASGLSAWWAGSGRGAGGPRVVGVEPEGSCALHAALEAGRPVDVAVHSIAADSLGARNVGDLVFAVASQTVNRVVLVGDDAIREAQRHLWRDHRIAVEPGGAAALAALLSGAYRPRRGEALGILLCGANLDAAAFAAFAS